MNTKVNQQFFIITLMILLAAISRLLPHPPNFTAIGAMGLFGAAYLNKKVFAFMIPLAAMFMTDLFLNNVVYSQYIPEGQSFVLMTEGGLWIYGGIVLTILVGFMLLEKVSAFNVVVGTLISSLIFFALTNFGVWFSGVMYPDNIAGLGACFAAGLPYLLNSILGNLFYGGILFGGFYAINKVFYPTTTTA